MTSRLCSCKSRPFSAASRGLLALVCLLSAASARADGAFADSKAVLLPREQPQRILASSDVAGLVVSEDAGATWSWICENAIGRFAALFQVGPAPEESLYAITQTGLSISDDDGCSWQRPQGVTQRAGDVFPDPNDPTHVFSIVQTTAGADSPEYGDSVVQSHDGGETFGTTMYFTTSASLTGVEQARSDPSTIYLAMSTLMLQRPYIVRSTDGGGSWTEINLTTQLQRKPLVIRIIAVDPNDARTLYMRVSDGQQDALAISRDGGDTLQIVQQLNAKMSAFLLRADGNVLLTSADGQSFRSTDAGASFAPWLRTPSPNIQALAERAGVLYASTTSRTDGYAIAKSTDDGEHWQPLLRLEQLRGPLACGEIAQQCQSEWTQLQKVLPKLSGPPLDAATAALLEQAAGRHESGGCAIARAPGTTHGGQLVWCGAAVGCAAAIRRKLKSRAA